MKKTITMASAIALMSFSSALLAAPVKLTCNASKKLQDEHFSVNIARKDSICNGNPSQFGCKMKRDLQRWKKSCTEQGIDWHHQLVTYFDSDDMNSKQAQQIVNNCWDGKAKDEMVDMSVTPDYLHFGSLSVNRATLRATRSTEKYYQCTLETISTTENKI
tara:strand:- start:2068 stop:2550 length:483 start_codon:yes stop_codon:yes gene_type:complete